VSITSPTPSIFILIFETKNDEELIMITTRINYIHALAHESILSLKVKFMLFCLNLFIIIQFFTILNEIKF
jgi:hypothetical protein